MNPRVFFTVFLALNIFRISNSSAQGEVDFKVVPGEICASIQPDIKYIFKDISNYFLVEAGPNTFLTDTIVSGADLKMKNGLIELIPYPDAKKVVLNFEARFGESGNYRTIERTFTVCEAPEARAGRVECDSVIDAYTFLLCGHLESYSKELRNTVKIDSFTIQWVTERQIKEVRMTSNSFPKEFREDLLKKRNDQPVYFTNIYGSFTEGIPMLIPQCQFFITETVAPVKWSIGDE